jgi:FlaA1/EpsC-like NDP-sugar epimerase
MVADMNIDRLIVRAPGLSEDQGRRLALQIAAQLAPAGGLPAAGDLPRLEVRAAAARSVDVRDLAQRIVDEALRQLRRST